MIDGHVASIVRRSVIYRTADAALAVIERSWVSSWVHRRAAATASPVRFRALATASASAVALVLAPYGTTPVPLGWIVPLTSGLAALVIYVLAPER